MRLWERLVGGLAAQARSWGNAEQRFPLSSLSVGWFLSHGYKMAMPLPLAQPINVPADWDGHAFQDDCRLEPIPPHRHEWLEFNLVVAGSARVQLPEQRYDLGPGTLVWLFPGQVHQLVAASPDFVVWVAVFRPSLVQRSGIPEVLVDNPPGRHCRHLRVRDAQALTGALRAVTGMYGDWPTVNRGFAFLLAMAWTTYVRNPERSVAEDAPSTLATAMHLLVANPGLTGDELAARCGLSRARLSRQFHRQFGETISARRERLLVDAFLRRREQHPGTMLDDALAVGFGSYSQFNRSFRRIMGLSPRAWEHSEGMRPG